MIKLILFVTRTWSKLLSPLPVKKLCITNKLTCTLHNILPMNIVVISSVVCGDNFSIPRMWFFMCIRMNPLSIYQIWTSPKYITYLPLWKLSKYSKCIPDTGYNNNTTTTIIHNNIQKTNKIIWLCGAWQAFYIHGIRLCMNKMKLGTCVGFGTIKRLNLRYIDL